MMSTMFLGFIILALLWIWEHASVYLRWVPGCLISVFLVVAVTLGLPLLSRFLINL